MNRDVLSQEEIDALLKQGSSEPSVNNASEVIELSDFEADALGEIGNISFGSAATALSTLLNQKVDITTPKVDVVRKDSLNKDFPMPHVAIKVEYTDGFRGANVLAIRVNDAGIIADLMLGGDGTGATAELNEMHLSAVAEAMNQMMGSASTSMSTIFSMMVNITPPTIDVIDLGDLNQSDLFPDSEYVVRISFRLIIGTLIDSHIMQLLPVQFAKDMIGKLIGGSSEEGQAAAAVEEAQEPVAAVAAMTPSAAGMPSSGAGAPVQEHIENSPAPAAAAPGYAAQSVQDAAMFGHPSAPMPMAPGFAPPAGYGYSQPGSPAGYGYPPVGNAVYPNHPYPHAGTPPIGPDRAHGVQPVQFASFEAAAAGASPNNLDLLLDIPLSITVELGRARKQIREILDLAPGAIIELDKLAGEPVDILVNNKLIAKGEVVVIEENFGVRVTDIISPAERIRKLQ